jgi:hypothetical protein
MEISLLKFMWNPGSVLIQNKSLAKSQKYYEEYSRSRSHYQNLFLDRRIHHS